MVEVLKYIWTIRLREDRCHEITHFGDSDIGKQKRKVSILTSHLAKSRNDLDHPSVEDTWWRSRVHRYFGYWGFKLTEDLCHWGSQVAKSRNDEDCPSEGGDVAAIQDFGENIERKSPSGNQKSGRSPVDKRSGSHIDKS
jgi:hypothetical protein